MIFIIIWIVDSFHHQNNCELIHGFDKMIIAILDSKIFFYRFPQVKKRHGKKVYPSLGPQLRWLMWQEKTHISRNLHKKLAASKISIT